MTLFTSIFGDSENKNSNASKINWIPLTDLRQLNEIMELSHQQPVAIFKHSTRCSISRMALKQFENEFDLEGIVTPYFLDLLNHRDISQEIATRFEVYHQSPQLILIKEGKAVYDASHSDIDALELKGRV
jgi:bacillithiol system protein YtxJ